MKDITIIKQALTRNCISCSYPPYNYCELSALERIESLLKEAPKFFSYHDFDEEKLKWLKRAGLIEEKK